MTEQEDRDLYLSAARYRAALERIRGLIAAGGPLVAEDSTTVGDKYTRCSWGLCSHERAAWPDADDHLWPDLFLEHGRIAPRYRQPGQRCPMDRREAPDGFQGCFYTCRIFLPQKGEAPMSQEEALRLYDEQIRRGQE
jgi:hypothetical protein